MAAELARDRVVWCQAGPSIDRIGYSGAAVRHPPAHDEVGEGAEWFSGPVRAWRVHLLPDAAGPLDLLEAFVVEIKDGGIEAQPGA